MKTNQIFRISWEIVEHADSIGKLMPAIGDLFINTPGFSDLEIYLNKASQLRNKKVHLFHNITNLVKRKKLNFLHGVIKWTHGINRNQQSLSYLVKILTIEPMTHNVSFKTDAGIEDIKCNVDNLILEAFDERINISRLVSTFNQYANTLEAHLADIVKNINEDEVTSVEELEEAEREPLYVTIKVIKDMKS